jgi:hypothetical protein
MTPSGMQLVRYLPEIRYFRRQKNISGFFNIFRLLAVSAVPVPPPIPHLDKPGSVRPTTHVDWSHFRQCVNGRHWGDSHANFSLLNRVSSGQWNDVQNTRSHCEYKGIAEWRTNFHGNGWRIRMITEISSRNMSGRLTWRDLLFANGAKIVR